MTVSISGTAGVTFPDNSVQNTSAFVGGLAFRNRIINGAMVIDQRNAGASVMANDGVYSVDRFMFGASQTSKGTVQQNAGAVTPPVGFSNYYGFTSSSAYSILSTDFFAVSHKIEGNNIADFAWGTANAATITMSFWVRSSLTGTFGGALENSANDRCYPFSYTISAANTWEQKTLTIAGDTSGTWLTTTGLGIAIRWGLGVGSTRSGTAGAWGSTRYFSATGAVSVVGTNAATWYVTGVQLEKGSTATAFDYRPYGTELALCQRYYWRYINGVDQSLSMGCYYNSTSIYGLFQTPVTMRSKPTLISSSGTNYYRFVRNGATDDFDSVSLDGYEHAGGAIWKNTTEASGTSGQAGFVSANNASSSIALSAEL